MFVKQVEVGRFAVFAYLLGSETTGDALVIDPAADGEWLVKEAEKHKLRIIYIVEYPFPYRSRDGQQEDERTDGRQNRHS